MDNECVWLVVCTAEKGSLEFLEEIWKTKDLLNSELYIVPHLF